jgi:hypothetical protein
MLNEYFSCDSRLTLDIKLMIRFAVAKAAGGVQ